MCERIILRRKLGKMLNNRTFFAKFLPYVKVLATKTNFILIIMTSTTMAFGQAGMVQYFQKISEESGGFIGLLGNYDSFGTSVTNLGDLDGNGIDDLVVGARGDDDGGPNRGAVWILFLRPNGYYLIFAGTQLKKSYYSGPDRL